MSTKRRIITAAAFLLMVATLFASIKFTDDRTYYYVSLLLIVYMMIPFFAGFEARRPQTGEVVIIAVLIALAVVSRAAFFFIPQVKPIAAIVIISGVSLGPSSGFLIGAMSMFVSNFLFGQGPWTPWQMFAMGLVGLIAGLLASNILKSKRTLPICIYGAIAVFFIYGIIVDLWTVFGFTPEPNWQILVLVYGSALWFNAIFAISTAVFLAFFTRPMLKKLTRIQNKYGLLAPACEAGLSKEER